MSFFNELKRRNVIRVGLAYMITAWLLIQVAETIFPLFGFDDAPARLVVIVLAIGLVPALIFAWVFEVTPEGIKQEKDIDRSQSVTPQTGQKLNRAIISMLVVALGYFVIDKFVLSPQREASLQQEMATKVASASEALGRSADAKSIAVLPFANMSGDPANEPFTLGIHDDLLTQLSRIKSLKTISRTSVLQYRGTTKTIPEIAAELGVQHVLEGGIQRAGDRVRINLQLIDAGTDEHLWAEVYDRELTANNLFDVQAEITTQVTRSLRAALLPEEQTVLKARPTQSMEAYDLYLLGRHHWNERTGESIEKARGFFNQAIAADPGYVLAYSGLADAYSLLIDYGNMTGAEAIPMARDALDKAMALDNSVSEVWASRGLLLYAQGDHPEAAKALVRAIELDQQNFSAWLWYGNTLNAMRRYDEQLAALETAFSLEPMSPPVNNNLAVGYRIRGDFERSLQHVDRLLSMRDQDIERYRLEKVSSYFWSGQLAKAVAEARGIVSSNPESVQAMSWLIDAYIALGDLEQADTWAERVSELDPAIPWRRDIFEARQDFEGAMDYISEIKQLPVNSEESWFSRLLFRYAYLDGQGEAATSYFNEYTSVIRGFAEINPSGSWQRGELRLAEFMINNSTGTGQRSTGEKMRDEALSALQRLNSLGYNHPGTYYGMAMAWSLKGEYDKALDALDKAVSNGYTEPLSLSTEPALNPLRQAPRFPEIVGRMNQRITGQQLELANTELAPYRPVARVEPVELPRQTLENYAGYYTDGTVVINFHVNEDGNFMARMPNQPDMRALPSAIDTFYAEEAPGYSAQFFVDENDVVTHIMARGGRGLQRFKPVDPPPQVIVLEADALKRFEGTYSARLVREAGDGEADTDISTVRIQVDDENRVWLHQENQAPQQIKPYAETEFFIPGFIHRFRFELSPINGSVERLVRNQDGNELEFKPQ